MEELTFYEGNKEDVIVTLGISEERAKELGKECEVIFNMKAKEGEPPQTITGKLNEVIKICENMNEVAWAIFNFGVNVGVIHEKRLNSGSLVKSLIEVMKK